jgi:hypothetical protein
MGKLTKLDKLFAYGYKWKDFETCYSVYTDWTLAPTFYTSEWTYTKKQKRFSTPWREEENNVLNRTNLVHNLFLVYLSISTCFGRLWVHHQEKQLCVCDTWYLLLCVDDCLVCRVEWIFIPPCIPDSHPYRTISTKCRKNTVVSTSAGPIVDRNM